jgi:hypothetical protein
MRNLVDALISLAVLVVLVGLGFRFFSPNMGFGVGQSSVTPLFLWRGAIGLLILAGVLILRQIRDKQPST